MSGRWLTGLVLGTLLLSGTAVANEDTDRADAFIALLRAGDFHAACERFDSVMGQAMSEERLAQTWKTLGQQVGGFSATLSHRQTMHGDLVIVDSMASFERAELAIRVVFNPQGQVSGLFFLPPDRALPESLEVQAGAKERVNTYRTPDYVKPGIFTVHEVTVGKTPWELGGVITIPVGEGPFPAVVLIAGSGPNDRDETIGPSKPFRDIAEGLSSRGIVVLRYDKRTHTHGESLDAAGITVEEEVLADARAAIAFLRAQPSVDNDHVYVLGHSLGGTLAPVIAGESDVSGVIVLAGSARPLAQVLVGQLAYIGSLPGHQGGDEQRELETMKSRLLEYQAGKLRSTDMVFGATVGYLDDLERRKPLEKAWASKIPYLVLQGGRDYQVTGEDFDLWKKALASHSNATFRYYDDLNHLFAGGKGMATPEEYARPQSVSPGVVTDVADWIEAQAGAVGPPR